MVRSSIKRNNYKVEPGLYAAGIPNDNSDVFVSANYKLSFDVLRKNLSGLSAWILVLDTKGVNVWCAAGKGTFGTEELLRQIKLTSLQLITKRRRLILPQLGAPGIAAHVIKKISGFNVVFGPVRAKDIKGFLHAHFKASDEMRLVKFNLFDRVKLIPVDFVNDIRYLFGLLIPVYLFFLIFKVNFSFLAALKDSIPVMLNIFLGYVSGIVITPLLLPYIPVRSFALKGCMTGLLISIILLFANMFGKDIAGITAWLIFIPAFSSYLAMNFTGSSTYTSLSGVKREMKIAVPLQIASVAISFILVLVDIFIMR